MYQVGKEAADSKGHGPNWGMYHKMFRGAIDSPEQRIVSKPMPLTAAQAFRARLNRFRVKCRKLELGCSESYDMCVVRLINSTPTEASLEIEYQVSLFNVMAEMAGVDQPSLVPDFDLEEDKRIDAVADVLAHSAVPEGTPSMQESLAKFGMTPKVPTANNEPLRRDSEYYSGQVENKPVDLEKLFKEREEKPDIDK
jgi:hypothetical protein